MRKAVGDYYPLMLDSTWTYDYPTALRVGRAVEELDFHWFEDPLADQDIYNYVKLQAEARHPDSRHRISRRTASMRTCPGSCSRRPTSLRGDVAVKGGITTLVKTAHLAEAFRMITRCIMAAIR